MARVRNLGPRPFRGAERREGLYENPGIEAAFAREAQGQGQSARTLERRARASEQAQGAAVSRVAAAGRSEVTNEQIDQFEAAFKAGRNLKFTRNLLAATLERHEKEKAALVRELKAAEAEFTRVSAVLESRE